MCYAGLDVASGKTVDLASGKTLEGTNWTKGVQIGRFNDEHCQNSLSQSFILLLSLSLSLSLKHTHTHTNTRQHC